ncbi:MAG: hypothetical protein ABIH17_09790 [Pseudomonadota bacterium]
MRINSTEVRDVPTDKVQALKTAIAGYRPYLDLAEPIDGFRVTISDWGYMVSETRGIQLTV